MKRITLLLLTFLLVTGMTLPAAAEMKPVTFTHPELGEIIEVSFSRRMPVITLYGYKYYEIMDTAKTPYRGMKTSGMYNVSSKSLTPEAAMAAFYTSVEGRGSEPAVITAYTGTAESWADALAALPEAQRISALLLLNGFGGADSYGQLKAIPGFENADTSALAAGYQDYTVDVYGKRAQYRVLMFSITEPDGTFYMERYCFLRPYKVWQLHEITREYINDYDARARYIHGLAGSVPAELNDVNTELLRGLEWGMTSETVALTEKNASANGSVSEGDALLYRLQAKLDYIYKDNGLTGMTYTLTGGNAYFAAFVSLYMRYADPSAIDKNHTMTWSLENFTVTLRYDTVSPMVEVSPRYIASP